MRIFSIRQILVQMGHFFHVFLSDINAFYIASEPTTYPVNR